MFHTRHHGLTPTQNSPTIYLKYHHWQKLARGGEQCLGSSTANTYKPKKQWGRVHWHRGLLSEPVSRPRNLFSVCCIAGKKKSWLKSELHEFFPGLSDRVVCGIINSLSFDLLCTDVSIWGMLNKNPTRPLGGTEGEMQMGTHHFNLQSLCSFLTLGLTGTGSWTRRSPNTPPPAPPLA